MYAWDTSEYLAHIGKAGRSGRYPHGWGVNPHQHCGEWIGRYNAASKAIDDGEIPLTNPDNGKKVSKEWALAMTLGIVDEFGNPSTGRLRVQKQVATLTQRKLNLETAKRLRDKEGYTNQQIADKLGYPNESSVRSLFNEETAARKNVLFTTAETLKKEVDKHKIVEIGKGAEKTLGVSKDRLEGASFLCELDGYHIYKGRYEQPTNPGKFTTYKFLCAPGTEYKEIYNPDNVHILDPMNTLASFDGGETFKHKRFTYPESLDSKRLMVRTAEEGGKDRDGVIELRPGVEDLSLGNSHYAQARILVDGTHYLKGVAVYAADTSKWPKGVDVVFNSNKSKDVPVMGDKNKSHLKLIKRDKNGEPMANPFGSLIKSEDQGGQYWYTGKDGKEHLGLINKRSDEGDWGEWSDGLPSQFLSKQSQQLAKRQLGLASADKKSEYNEIMALTNPTIKKKMLLDFADECDSAAVDLQAAALPRSAHQLILPIPSLKDNEIYAPNYHDGETVALVRYPHGGTFEIPILKVNNKNKEASKMITANALDAVGINGTVAEQLSGADFDGDTAMVIPCNSRRSSVNIKATKPLEDLVGFDAKVQYGGKEEGTYKRMSEETKGKEMGIITNLIADMTLKGAPPEDLAKATKHSMVVIDAPKHGLDYQASYIDNDIARLKKEYQGWTDPETGETKGGASTIVSLAKNPTKVIKRQGQPKIDPKTGKLIYKIADDAYYEKKHVNKRTGEVTYTTETRLQDSNRMKDTDDAYTLVSGHPMENLYAEYANTMKSLANEARKATFSVGKLERSASAAQTYAEEVSHLNAELDLANRNKPKEKLAILLTTSAFKAVCADNPDLTNKEKGKIKAQIMQEKRDQVGASRHKIHITDREWEAIQAGAISDTKLKEIMQYADQDRLKELATPRTKKTVSPAKEARIKSMHSAGFTNAEIAAATGLSTSTIAKYIRG